MYRGSGPRIVPLIVAVLVVAFVIAGLVMVGRMIFSGDKQSNGDKKNGPTLVDSVLNQDESRSVRWTIRGPIVANEKFKSYQITVSPSERTFVTYSGYLDDVIDTKKYSNNKQAYEQFVYALNNANITATHAAKDADFRGVCATEGIAYMFEALVVETQKVRWQQTHSRYMLCLSTRSQSLSRSSTKSTSSQATRYHVYYKYDTWYYF